MLDYLQFKPDKLKLKEALILFPMDRTGLTSYLSPILGQYAIKNTDFIACFLEEFNKKTNNLLVNHLNTEKVEENGLTDFELIIPLKIKAYKAGKFSIVVNYPQITFLQKNYIRKKRKLFKLIRNWRKKETIAYPFINCKKILQMLTFRFLNETSIDNSTLLQDQLTSLKTNYHNILNSALFRRNYIMVRQRFKSKRN